MSDIGFFERVGTVRAMRRLKPDPVPDEYGVVVTIPIGYPMGNVGPVSRKPAAEVTWFDRWGRRETSPG